MKKLKRLVAMLMLLSIVFTMIPAQVFATQGQTQSSVDMGDVSIQGTNGFGTLLSQEINRNQAESDAEAEEYDPGYSVTDLVIEDGIAYVTYGSMEDAVLVVALYTEDGMKMLTSVSGNVTEEDTEAELEFEGELPQFFMASAYLVDSYDYSPLCEPYDTPMYTKDMQELLASTVDDYDEERVLNLDDDKTTNFAVYAEKTILIEAVPGVNNVTTADHENSNYVIENADDQIKNLKEGDIFVYPYAEEEILIVKVGTIKTTGSKVTITGDEMELEEAFEAVKVESMDNSDNLTVDDSVADEGVTFEGFIDNPTTMKKGDGKIKASKALSFKVNKTFEGDGTKVEVGGSVSFSVDVTLKYYVSAKKQYIDFRLDTEAKFALSLSASLEAELQFAKAALRTPAGVSIAFKPTLIFEIGGTIEFHATFSNSVGFRYDRKKGFKAHKGKPIFDPDIEAEVTIFVGIDLKPRVEIAEGVLAEFGLSMPIGLELSITGTGNGGKESDDDDPSRHECVECLKIEPAFKISLGVEMQFLKCKWLKVERDILTVTIDLKNLYFSSDHGEWGKGSCPYRSYRVTFKVTDKNNQPIDLTILRLSDGTILGKTDMDGKLVCYLKEDNYDLSAIISGKEVTRKFEVSDSCLVTLSANKNYHYNTGEASGSTGAVDAGIVLYSGNCGVNGSNVTWKIFGNGLLLISGKGEMKDYDYNTPWRNYSYIINRAKVENGVTKIGNFAFAYCSNLKSVTIADSVTKIGDLAFFESENLTDVTLPNSINKISGSAFSGCSGLESLVIPDSVTTISNSAFYDCINLSNITIPDGVTTIGSRAFQDCDSLTRITIPEGVTVIEDHTFYSCQNLRSVTIPGSVEKISWAAFAECYQLSTVSIQEGITWIDRNAFQCTNLENIAIPNSVLYIGSHAFEGCTNLSSITLPEHMISIGDSAFSECTSLTNITIPEGITSIDSNAFYECTNLENVILPSSLEEIRDAAFDFCTSLTGLTIPKNVSYIRSEPFLNCSSLEYIHVEAGNSRYRSDNGVLIDNNTSTLIRMPEKYDGTYTIPNDITTIGDFALSGCRELTGITIPTSVTSIGENAFSGCSSLPSVTIPNTVNTIRHYTFYGCSNLSKITLPDTITSIGQFAFDQCLRLTELELPNSVQRINIYAFRDCDNLRDLRIPGSVQYIGEHAFTRCDNLTSVTIDNGLSTLNYAAFSQCPNLKSVFLPISLTQIGNLAFYDCYNLSDIYYSGTEDQWNSITIGSNNQCFTNATIHYNSTGAMPTSDAPQSVTLIPEEVTTEIVPAPPAPQAVYPGEYDTEEREDYTLKSASFKDLVPGEQYLLLAMKSVEVENLLDADNLLFIDQAAALEDGTLCFYYIQRETMDISYVVACGASNKDLKDAEITFPEMIADGTLQVIDPTVVYDGETLTEGIDYTVVGTVDFTDAGTYTCSIRGIRNYTGLVECTYTVNGIDLKPDAPTLSISNVASSGKIKLSWKAVEGAVQYEVYRATSKTGTFKLLKTTSNTSFTNTSTTAGNAYYYYVVAVAEDGSKSDPSATKSRTCDLARPVATLTNAESSGKIEISWASVDGAIGYTVYRASGEDTEFEVLDTTKDITITDVSATAGNTYSYKVVALAEKSAANSAYSEVNSLLCKLAQPVVETSNVASSGKIKLTWETVENAEKYEVYRADTEDGEFKLMKTTTNTFYTNTSAKAGNTYSYKIVAVHTNTAANSADSEIKTQICALAQPKVTTSNVASSGKIKIGWESIDGATGYQVYRAESKSGEYKLMKTTNSTSYTNTSAKAGTAYYYKVKAIAENSAADSEYSEIKSRTCDLPRPNVTISRNSSGKPKVSWDAVDGAVSYKVYRADTKDGEYALMKTTSNTSYTNTSATAGNTYHYKVVAVHTNTNANSAKSSSVSIKCN